MTIEITKAEYKTVFGLCFLFFICLLTTSCSGGVSKFEEENDSRKNVTVEKGFVKVTGKDDGTEYECSGFDPNFTTDPSIYSCDGNELVINR
ncbi:hypothetical protein IQ247_23330 [Plectonema cf. radiosum LEGE 06105]|uniref:Lipoprotein n=1 Tax=Plectonema cf. radiosum LEGE 06105 TaxID=945769 RepID=A0A8J7K660_9CYAN|nr:hypothetical protein [Plectonema radiosum]MBE9215562.1 hypothetical protein [Plectonema cf. radiosum LEGE 06105]